MRADTGTGKPLANGTKIGQVVQTQSTGGMGTKNDVFWKWNGADWEQVTKVEFEQYKGSTLFDQLESPTLSSATGAKRYPRDVATAPGADYVLFEFYEYRPPFQNINKGATKDSSTPVATYNESVTRADFYEKTSELPVVLYMPEDISTGFRSNWGGKAFSNIATDALRSAGAEGMGKLTGAVTGFGNLMSRAPYIAGAQVIRKAISGLSGDNLSNDDVFGAISGAILNPNTELLFSGVDMRNFQLEV